MGGDWIVIERSDRLGGTLVLCCGDDRIGGLRRGLKRI